MSEVLSLHSRLVFFHIERPLIMFRLRIIGLFFLIGSSFILDISVACSNSGSGNEEVLFYNGSLSIRQAKAYILSQFKKMATVKKDTVSFKNLAFIFSKYPLLTETRDEMGWTLLHEAAHEGNFDMVKMLIDSGADPSARTDAVGDTPLHLAARIHAFDVIILLFEDYEIDEELNDLNKYPFDHDCTLCPIQYLDLVKKVIQNTQTYCNHSQLNEK